MSNINRNDMIRRTSPIDHNVLFSILPYVVWPMFNVIIVVNVPAVSSRLSGRSFVFPITICTASASPNALAIPSTTAVSNVGNAAGISTFLIVCHLVAPSAYEPSRRCFGSDASASAEIDVTVGKIITESTIVPARRL